MDLPAANFDIRVHELDDVFVIVHFLYALAAGLWYAVVDENGVLLDAGPVVNDDVVADEPDELAVNENALIIDLDHVSANGDNDDAESVFSANSDNDDAESVFSANSDNDDAESV